ncbi:hypothetical protein GP486_003604, partial [Trichoglossum hirsutum]
MVQEFESLWRVFTQYNSKGIEDRPPFRDILKFNKKVELAVEVTRKEAWEHVEMLQATKKHSEATLVAQRIASCGQCLQLPNNTTVVDLQTLVRLSENQEDLIAAEHYQERLLELMASIDHQSQRTTEAMEKLWHLYQRSEQKLVSLMASWGLNTTIEFHISPLYRLVRLNGEFMASAELRWRPDPKSADILGRSPLHIAAELNAINTLTALTPHHNSFRRTDHFGRTALSIASGLGHLEAVQLLLERGSINAELSCSRGMTALQAASHGGHLEVVQLLLERGASINAEPSDSTGMTALQAASQGGHLEVVQLLLGGGANAYAEPSNHKGMATALQAASQGGHLE